MKHLQIQENFDASKLEKPYVVINSENEVYYTPAESTFEYVDLGLPSGLKWAKCNVGAETETDYGKYFQWGDVEGSTADEINSKPCNWSTTPWGLDTPPMEILDAEHDAASVNMSDNWRMPTKEDFEELTANTNSSWETNFNGSDVNGYLFRSTKDMDKYIFIPVAGYARDGSLGGRGRYGSMWSSSLNSSDPSNAWLLYFDSDYLDVSYSSRCYGYSVRGVCE